MYGLKPHTIKAIQDVFAKHKAIEKAILYGSRAKGNYRNGSDIDITLVGKTLTLSKQFSIETDLDDLLLPYKMDISILHKIENEDLKDHINRVGINLYNSSDNLEKSEDENEWDEVSIQDVVTKLGDGLHGTPKYDDKGEYYFINGNNLKNGRIVFKDSTRRVNKSEFEKYKKELTDRTILVSINGTIGNVAVYNNEKCVLGKSACYFNVKENINKEFIKYVVTDRSFQEHIKLWANGTTIKNVSLKTMREYSFNLPSIQEQKAIANALSSLDNKIDLLYRQNKTLEGLSKALFRQWFDELDFESTISDLIDVQNGYAFKSKDFADTGIDRVIKIRNISNNMINITSSDFISSEVANKTNNKFKISTGDILFAMTGAEIGKMGIMETTEVNLWLNQRVGLFKEKYEGSKFLAYLCLQSDFGQDYIEHAATGSAQPNISSTGIEACPFPKLSATEIKEYSNQLIPLYKKVIFNLGEIKTLEKLRDTLLPKLMSGEIRIKN